MRQRLNNDIFCSSAVPESISLPAGCIWVRRMPPQLGDNASLLWNPPLAPLPGVPWLPRLREPQVCSQNPRHAREHGLLLAVLCCHIHKTHGALWNEFPGLLFHGRMPYFSNPKHNEPSVRRFGAALLGLRARRMNDTELRRSEVVKFCVLRELCQRFVTSMERDFLG